MDNPFFEFTTFKKWVVFLASTKDEPWIFIIIIINFIGLKIFDVFQSIAIIIIIKGSNCSIFGHSEPLLNPFDMTPIIIDSFLASDVKIFQLHHVYLYLSCIWRHMFMMMYVTMLHFYKKPWFLSVGKGIWEAYSVF